MRILGIETSCDETALSIVEAEGGLTHPKFSLVGSTLLSQIDVHKEYGGVFPALAKREHAKNIIPLLKKLLKETNSEKLHEHKLNEENLKNVSKILEREYNLLKDFLDYIQTIQKPGIDVIAVTYGPGLEPALWVGVNFAEALGLIWNIPVIPTNHMEGHVISPLLHKESPTINFPSLALLISGGHTELVLVKKWGEYELIGKTRDDAVGEAFDKVARLLGLPYPGGPQVSKLAHEARTKNYNRRYTLPRPMIHSDDFDFSFSGIKTAVLYTLRDNPTDTHELKADLAREFEDAVTEVLLKKTVKALETSGSQSLIIGGGVIANTHLRNSFVALAAERGISLHIPEQALTTDNATMIAMAGYIASHKDKHQILKADGNASLASL